MGYAHESCIYQIPDGTHIVEQPDGDLRLEL